MRVLLINPPVLGGRYHSAQTAIPPLGLGYLAAAIRASGMECSVLDGKLDNPPIEVILAEVAARRPDVVGISAMTPDIVAAGKIAEAVKKSNSSIRVALGGAHAIARPRETLEEFPWVDYLVTGEGERTFTELLRSLSDGSDQDSILGLGFRKNGEIVINPPREYIRNLDETPFPAWDLFPGRGNVFFLLASRGCPYTCAFCMRALGREVRLRSPESIVEEMELLVNRYKAKEIVFADETFSLKKDRVMRLCDLIVAKGLDKRVRWVAQTRVDRSDQEMFARMKAAGCYRLEFGVESGNQEILRGVDKRISLPQVLEAVGMAKKVGLVVATTFILGHPFETEKTIQDTIDFAVRLRPDFVSFGVMSPYPGTKIWDMAQVGDGNYRLVSNDWADFTRFGGGSLELTNISAQRLEYLSLKAYMMFYLRTMKLFRLAQYVLPRLAQSKAALKKLLSHQTAAGKTTV